MNILLGAAKELQYRISRLSSDDPTPIEFIDGFSVEPIPADAHSQWQMAVDIIHRCLMCGLIEVWKKEWMKGVGVNDHLGLVKALARHDPYNKIQFNQSGATYWLEPLLQATDRCEQLIEKHNVVWYEEEISLLCEPFIKELETLFSNAGVPWGKSFFPIDLSSTYQSYMDRINGSCDAILAWVFERGTLSQFPRVVAYLTKENGGEKIWEDTYQNQLIAGLKSSVWFKSLGENLYCCTVDQSVWKHESEKWRVNAYKERLICVDAKINDLPEIGAKETGHPVFYSKDFLQHGGLGPTGLHSIDLHFFVSYLTELQDGSHAAIPASLLLKTNL